MTDTSIKSSTDYSTPDFSSRAKTDMQPEKVIPSPAASDCPRPLFGHRFGAVDMAVIGLCAACLMGILLINETWLSWSLAGTCVALMFSPEFIQRRRRSRELTLKSIFLKFRKCGLHPVISGDMLTWEHDGKRNSVRLVNGCQLQVFREYPIEADMNGKFETAASATMSEVFSAKVGIHKNDGDGNCIFFSTEMLCSSMKDFDRILPATVQILDTAEDRQRVNLQEILAREKTPAKKIGFRTK